VVAPVTVTVMVLNPPTASNPPPIAAVVAVSGGVAGVTPLELEMDCPGRERMSIASSAVSATSATRSIRVIRLVFITAPSRR
jgi:hypothetical protein